MVVIKDQPKTTNRGGEWPGVSSSERDGGRRQCIEAGMTALRAGDPGAAAARFREILRRRPHDVTAGVLLAWCHVEREAYAESVRTLRTVLGEGYGELAMCLHVALVYHQLGCANAAAEQLRKALSLRPDLTVARYLLHEWGAPARRRASPRHGHQHRCVTPERVRRREGAGGNGSRGRLLMERPRRWLRRHWHSGKQEHEEALRN